MTYFKESKEAKIHIGLWDFHKKYFDISTSDEIWKELLQEADKIYKRHNQSKFCRDMLSAVILLLNEQATEKLKGERMDGTRA